MNLLRADRDESDATSVFQFSSQMKLLVDRLVLFFLLLAGHCSCNRSPPSHRPQGWLSLSETRIQEETDADERNRLEEADKFLMEKFGSRRAEGWQWSCRKLALTRKHLRNCMHVEHRLGQVSTGWLPELVYTYRDVTRTTADKLHAWESY